MTNVFGSIVMKNEADRYLKPCLDHMTSFLDYVFVWDDQSTDKSFEIANSYEQTDVYRRPDDVPSFLEHEGQFRYAAWKTFEGAASPQQGDWVLSFDADEFLVANHGSVRTQLQKAITEAKLRQAVGVVLPVPEVFHYNAGVASVRTDGFWGKIKGPRFFEYRPNAVWQMKNMGCGSEPTYVAKGPLYETQEDLYILHFGYAIWEDRTLKYDRYNALEHGHSDSHIQSILKSPSLSQWTGALPETLR